MTLQQHWGEHLLKRGICLGKSDVWVWDVHIKAFKFESFCHSASQAHWKIIAWVFPRGIQLMTKVHDWLQISPILEHSVYCNIQEVHTNPYRDSRQMQLSRIGWDMLPESLDEGLLHPYKMWQIIMQLDAQRLHNASCSVFTWGGCNEYWGRFVIHHHIPPQQFFLELYKHSLAVDGDS